MKKILFSFFILFTTIAVAQQKKQPTKKVVSKPVSTTQNANTTILKDLKDSASYSLGVSIGSNLKAQGLDKIDAMLLYKGLNDILTNKKAACGEGDAQKMIQNYMQTLNAKKSVGAKSAGKKFLAENAKKLGIVSMPGGWQYQILKSSDSTIHPTATDKVKCHYHGTLTDGTIFDSSVDRGEPATFGLNQVIKGWTIAVQMMTVGSKWKIFLPSDLAYGDNSPSDKIPGGSTLIFEIELLAIEK